MFGWRLKISVELYYRPRRAAAVYIATDVCVYVIDVGGRGDVVGDVPACFVDGPARPSTTAQKIYSSLYTFFAIVDLWRRRLESLIDVGQMYNKVSRHLTSSTRPTRGGSSYIIPRPYTI